jgi:DHA2 family multidrug resistance protein
VASYQQQIDALRGTLDVTAGKANGLHLAQGQLYQHLQAQTQALAYVDVYYVLAFAAALMVPLAFLLDKNRPGGGGTVMME